MVLTYLLMEIEIPAQLRLQHDGKLPASCQGLVVTTILDT